MSSPSIPCVVLGKHRHIAESIAAQVGKHDYSVNAIFDEDNYSAANLDTVIRILHPRPQVLVIGGGFSDEEVEDGIEVWKKYVKDIGVSQTAIARIPVGSLEKLGPQGIFSWTIEELDKTYKK